MMVSQHSASSTLFLDVDEPENAPGTRSTRRPRPSVQDVPPHVKIKIKILSPQTSPAKFMERGQGQQQQQQGKARTARQSPTILEPPPPSSSSSSSTTTTTSTSTTSTTTTTTSCFGAPPPASSQPQQNPPRCHQNPSSARVLPVPATSLRPSLPSAQRQRHLPNTERTQSPTSLSTSEYGSDPPPHQPSNLLVSSAQLASHFETSEYRSAILRHGDGHSSHQSVRCGHDRPHQEGTVGVASDAAAQRHEEQWLVGWPEEKQLKRRRRRRRSRSRSRSRTRSGKGSDSSHVDVLVCDGGLEQESGGMDCGQRDGLPLEDVLELILALIPTKDERPMINA